MTSVWHLGEEGDSSLWNVVDEVAVAVAHRAERAPNSATSARAVSRELGVPWSTVRKILRCILHWYPYKIQIVQKLNPP